MPPSQFVCYFMAPKGLVGIAAATSNTYVVGLADSSAQHGFLKMKLTSLSAYVRDAFLPLEKGSI
jgi:hypothetical protein